LPYLNFSDGKGRGKVEKFSIGFEFFLGFCAHLRAIFRENRGLETLFPPGFNELSAVRITITHRLACNVERESPCFTKGFTLLRHIPSPFCFMMGFFASRNEGREIVFFSLEIF
jgi:hypothetical protein